MESFSIITRTSAKQYSKIFITGLYKKPVYILVTLYGLYILITVILNDFRIIYYYDDTPYFEIFAGFFCLLFPFLITAMVVRQFVSNPAFGHDIKYTFGENGMMVEGNTFKGEFLWAHIIKQKEIANFLVLYHSKRMGNFIDKAKLTSEQLQFIKAKVNENKVRK